MTLPVPTPRAALLLALGLAVPLLAGAGATALAVLGALDLLILALCLLDARLTPGAGSWRAQRLVRLPLSAFAGNPVELRLSVAAAGARRLDLADAPPAAFDSTGHRVELTLPAGGQAALTYQVVPRARGRHAFGDLHLRVLGPLGLAWRQLRVPLAEEVSVYPDLRRAGLTGAAATPEGGRARHQAGHEGREFAALRGYVEGDDLRSIDWKVTARRGAPVVREWQPERNQTVWLLLDCGRHLSARLADGRTKLDRAVDAALALARAAESRGDRTGAVLFGAEVERVVPPEGGRGRLGPLAEALHLAAARPVESDYGAAFDAFTARQRRRALLVVFSDLGDPETCALLLARATLLRRRHLVLVAAVSDAEVEAAARAWPADEEAAFLRATAERLLEERDQAAAQLTAAGVAVVRVPASALAGAVVGSYLEAKGRGAL